ncbi:MAG: MFS transporter [Rhodococcus sp. (in: high G+C Gram-positive bacteria)]
MAKSSPTKDITRDPRRAAFSSFVGTTIEWYDYYIFGTAAVLVLNDQFFPALDPFAATMASFATFSVAFVARPLGGAIFGHFGDRVSRKKMLVWSIVAMGLSTLVVGLLPNYESIGVWAPIALVFCRFIQGLAVGGEWGGAVLMALEHAPENKRAFYASWPQCGVPAGVVLSSGTFFFIQMMPEEDLHEWGWRIPFLLSVGLIIVGLYIRLKVTESPDFLEVKERGEQAKVPALDIFRSHKKSLVIGMLSTAAPNIVFYLATVFMLSYGPKVGIDRGLIFASLIAAAAVQVVSMPYIATFADKHSKRTILLGGAVLVAVAAFPIFALFNTGTVWGVLSAVFLALPIVHATSYGAVSSFIAELFPARVRFSGSALSYQLGGIVTSAPVPLLATLLFEKYHTSSAVALYVVGAALVSFIFISMAPRKAPNESRHDRTAPIEPSVA